MSQPKVLQVRTKLGGFVTPDRRDLLTDYNHNAPYAAHFTVEYDATEGFWMHGKTESVLIPTAHIACIIFESPAEDEATAHPAKKKA